MKYRIKLVSDEIENFSRVIEIDSHATFFDLRVAILDSVGYKKDEFDSFFMTDHNWDPREEIVAVDMGSSSSRDIWLMSETKLNEMFDDEGQRLIFLFDPLAQRVFYMELKEILPGSLDKPEIIKSVGKPPRQNIDFDEIDKTTDDAMKKAQKSEDFDEDFYGDSSFNEDELGSGFDDFNFN